MFTKKLSAATLLPPQRRDVISGHPLVWEGHSVAELRIIPVSCLNVMQDSVVDR